MRKFSGVALALAALVAFANTSAQAATRQLHNEIIGGDIDLEVDRFAADGDYLLLWLRPGFGGAGAHAAMATGMTRLGVEVWMVDFIDALFLPRQRSSQLAIEPDLIAELVALAHQRTGKQVVLMAVGGGAVPVLRGARAWQTQFQAADNAYLAGVVLLAPSLYQGVPSLGEEPRYMPIVTQTSIPVAVVQPGRRIGAQRLVQLSTALATGGSEVYSQLLPGLGSPFARPEMSAAARRTVNTIPQRISALLPLLDQSRTAMQDFAAAPQALEAPSIKRRRLDDALKPFTGQPLPLPIDLIDSADKRWQLSDYRGGVTVINFWASWCPPCVEEIPSLSRLQHAMGDDMRLISIDSGESAEVVRAFLQRVEVDFPVLLDADGRVAGAWKVIGLPSTFVIGPDGRIHYGANGALAWDSDEVIATLRKLANQAPSAN